MTKREDLGRNGPPTTGGAQVMPAGRSKALALHAEDSSPADGRPPSSGLAKR
ncbi:MAG TPA: hypothetical protein VNV44_06755 [Solirubrobacteraceae bacterium]|nr:hypothetical protein [Solirubrobacteraceae bacterium]